MIALLVNDTVERILDLRQIFWLQGILENGFVGFAKWSDDDLRRELKGRGYDSNPLAEAGENDSDEREECHDLLRLAGHLGSTSQLHSLQRTQD